MSFVFSSLQPIKTSLLLALLSSTAAACDTPVKQSVGRSTTTPATSQRVTATEPGADYSVEPIVISPKKAANLTVQVSYPRLRSRPGTAPTDTVGIAAFNREAKSFATGLVKEIETTARENRHDKIPTALQVSFRSYLLQLGMVSIAFNITQDGIGPRPITWATGLTYDLRAGRKLTPGDVFQQNAAFKAALLNTIQPVLDSSSDCQLEPDNMTWDNFVIGPDSYHLLLGDAQIGRACDTREISMPLGKLKPFAIADSPTARLNTEKR
ncbi:hypothetical protein [Hymenobacter negativus]|uniref:DUF3298 domain-containing protein n=1 Tax=Hymenobacter negativus TaxID=2795026 RepID=A0ABS3QP00_9BACT|nr:hypothetical protein [Hymenobacter negativus]MBO2013006.1 hypothetical protein [Hymenobacter negativus]